MTISEPQPPFAPSPQLPHSQHPFASNAGWIDLNSTSRAQSEWVWTPFILFINLSRSPTPAQTLLIMAFHLYPPNQLRPLRSHLTHCFWKSSIILIPPSPIPHPLSTICQIALTSTPLQTHLFNPSNLHYRFITLHHSHGITQESPAEGHHPWWLGCRKDVTHEPIRKQTLLDPVQGQCKGRMRQFDVHVLISFSLKCIQKATIGADFLTKEVYIESDPSTSQQPAQPQHLANPSSDRVVTMQVSTASSSWPFLSSLIYNSELKSSYGIRLDRNDSSLWASPSIVEQTVACWFLMWTAARASRPWIAGEMSS